MPGFFQYQNELDPLLRQKLLAQIGQQNDQLTDSANSFDYERERQERDANAREIFQAGANPEFSAGDIPGAILGAPGRLVQGLVGGLTGRNGGGAASYWADRPDLKMALATGVQGLPETQGNSFTDVITGAGERRARNMQGLMQALAMRRKLVEEPRMQDRLSLAQMAAQRANAAQSLTSGYENLATTEYGRGDTNANIGQSRAASGASGAAAINSLAHAALANKRAGAIGGPSSYEVLMERRATRDAGRKRKLELALLKMKAHAARTGRPDPSEIPHPKLEGAESPYIEANRRTDFIDQVEKGAAGIADMGERKRYLKTRGVGAKEEVDEGIFYDSTKVVPDWDKPLSTNTPKMVARATGDGVRGFEGLTPGTGADTETSSLMDGALSPYDFPNTDQGRQEFILKAIEAGMEDEAIDALWVEREAR